MQTHGIFELTKENALQYWILQYTRVSWTSGEFDIPARWTYRVPVTALQASMYFVHLSDHVWRNTETSHYIVIFTAASAITARVAALSLRNAPIGCGDWLMFASRPRALCA